MTAPSVSNAVAKREREGQLISWLRSQQDDLAMAAASHLKPSTIVRVAQGALRKDDKLMAAAIANPQSLIYCLLDAARLGHEPGTDQYWLIPFGAEVTGIEGYKGIIERMFRAGAVSAVVAEVVYQHDVYRSRGPLTPPLHEFDEFADPADRGPLKGAYAYARMFDGQYSRVIPMGRAEIMKHKAMSKGSNRSDSPWKLWEESMWKSKPLRALEAYVPTSSEWLDVRARAAAAGGTEVHRPSLPPAERPVAAITQASPPADDDVVDAEIVDEPVQPAARIEPSASRRSRPSRQGPAPDDDDHPWPGDATPAAQPGQPADAGDPRDDVTARLTELRVDSTAAQLAMIGRLTGKTVTTIDALTRKQAQWVAGKIAPLGSRDELEAVAVAQEAEREATGGQ